MIMKRKIVKLWSLVQNTLTKDLNDRNWNHYWGNRDNKHAFFKSK